MQKILVVLPAVVALLLEIAQNRNREKEYASKAGLTPAASHPVISTQDIEQAVAVTGLPAILKTATLGYDGKGQFVVESVEQLKQAFEQTGGVECVLEKKIALKKDR